MQPPALTDQEKSSQALVEPERPSSVTAHSHISTGRGRGRGKGRGGEVAVKTEPVEAVVEQSGGAEGASAVMAAPMAGGVKVEVKAEAAEQRTAQRRHPKLPPGRCRRCHYVEHGIAGGPTHTCEAGCDLS